MNKNDLIYLWVSIINLLSLFNHAAKLHNDELGKERIDE